jgi:arylsulfatase A-like enzyme
VDDRSVVAGVDWLPSVCKLANLRLPSAHPLDGEDVSDILMGAPRQRTKPLMWEWRFRIFGEPFHQSPTLAIREGNWKLLMNSDRSRVELYDINQDLVQLNNLASREPEVVARLSQKLWLWQKELPAGPFDPEAGRLNYPQPTPGKASTRSTR